MNPYNNPYKDSRGSLFRSVIVSALLLMAFPFSAFADSGHSFKSDRSFNSLYVVTVHVETVYNTDMFTRLLHELQSELDIITAYNDFIDTAQAAKPARENHAHNLQLPALVAQRNWLYKPIRRGIDAGGTGGISSLTNQVGYSADYDNGEVAVPT